MAMGSAAYLNELVNQLAQAYLEQQRGSRHPIAEGLEHRQALQAGLGL
jgi:hypothetical protein